MKGSELPRIRSGFPILEITCSKCGQIQKRTYTKLAPFNEQPASGIPIKIIPDTVENIVCGCGTRPLLL